MVKFDSGDDIGWVKANKIWYGKILKIARNSITGYEEYVIQLDKSNHNSVESYTFDQAKDWFRINSVSFNDFIGLPSYCPDVNHFNDASEYSVSPLDAWAYSRKTLSLPESFKACKHNFVQYNGLTDSFEYCTLCDEKKR
jgi:hypothetical protein